MSTMNAYLVRLDLLKMAKEMLEQEYFSKRDVLKQEWEIKASIAQERGQTVEFPEMPEYPNEKDIIAKAKTLNDFVSNAK
jgi:hypothetical protein